MSCIVFYVFLFGVLTNKGMIGVKAIVIGAKVSLP